MKKNQSAFGLRLRKARKTLGLNQAQLAELAETTPQTWGTYEADKVSPRLKDLAPLVERGISLDWLATGEGPMREEAAESGPADIPADIVEALRDLARDPEALAALRGFIFGLKARG